MVLNLNLEHLFQSLAIFQINARIVDLGKCANGGCCPEDLKSNRRPTKRLVKSG